MNYPDLFGLPMHPWPEVTLRDVPAFKLGPRSHSIERARQRALLLMLAEEATAVTEKRAAISRGVH